MEPVACKNAQVSILVDKILMGPRQSYHGQSLKADTGFGVGIQKLTDQR